MTEQIWWYATRAAGLMTWAMAMTSIVVGLVLSFSGRTRSSSAERGRSTLPSKPWLLDLHRFVGALAVVFLALHMVALWADSFVHFGWTELFVPGTSSWRPLAVAFGVVSAWLLVAVEASSLLKRVLPTKLWHRLHLGSYLVAAFGTVHAISAGSDIDNPLVATFGALALLLVAGLTLVRMLTIRSSASRLDPAGRSHQIQRARDARDSPLGGDAVGALPPPPLPSATGDAPTLEETAV